jgi:hypothetical protein
MTTTVSLDQAANLVKTCGTTNTFVFQGEPGIGKSAMLGVLSRSTSLEPRYVDCALLDLGDLQMPKVNDSLEFIPNKLFVSDKPILVMLDEIGKAMRPVQNALLTLLLEHRIGSHHLPEGSIVFATTNMATDGVGDKMESHAKNRVSFLRVSKPNAEQWAEWAIENSVAPEVIAWVKEYPHCLDTYTDSDGKTDNPYIFDPRTQQAAFVTPRSLAHASHIVKERKSLGSDVMMVALAGTIGESAARDMEAFLNVADALPPFKVIVEKPETTDVPESPIAATILALGAVMRVEPKNINNFLVYLKRLPREVQFLFAQNAMRSKNARTVVTSAEFTKWASDNSMFV